MQVRVRVGREEYALPVESVVEVAELGEITPVPGAGADMLGVRNLRGQVIPVLDLATMIGLPSDSVPERIVIAQRGERCAGLAVDAVLDVAVLPEPSRETDSGYLSGATMLDGTLVGFVDVDAVLTSRDES